MKFYSRKDKVFTLIIIGISLFLIGITINNLINKKFSDEGYWFLLLIFSVVGFLLWMFFGTNYELSKQNGFIYRNGPFRGKIKTQRITEIIKGKTLWVGFRPATARKGLIIKYDKYNELYISPKTNEKFIVEILKLNSEIKISE